MTTQDLQRKIAEIRKLLRLQTESDPLLEDISRKFDSHRFLGNCTQAVYQRQVQLLSDLLTWHLARPPAEISVHDWGCGKGHIAYMLQKGGFQVTASDQEDTTDDSTFGQKTPILEITGIHVIPLHDSVTLPFPTAHFDALTSFGVLEHVSNDLGSMKEIRRVLKKDGIFFVTFLPYPLSWTQAIARLRGNTYHDRLYWRSKLLTLAEASGFTVESMWLAQLLPKNSVPLRFDRILEPLDRFLCWHTPLRYFATNLEAILRAT